MTVEKEQRQELVRFHIDNDIFSVCSKGRVWRIKQQSRNRYGYKLVARKAVVADKHLSSNGYRRVSISLKGIKTTVAAHLLIYQMISGYPIPEGFVIHHYNGNRKDNRFSNLLLVSWQRNQDLSNWLHHFPGRTSEQMENDAYWIKRALETGQTIRDVAARFNIPETTCRRLEEKEIFDYL